MRKVIVTGLCVLYLSAPSYGWTFTVGSALKAAKDYTEKKADHLLDLARLVPILEDMKAMDKEKAEKLENINNIVQNTARGKYFKDEVNKIYTWEIRKQVGNVEEMSSILSRNGLKYDYFKKTENAKDRYVDHLMNIQFGAPDISESTQESIKETRQEGEIADELGEEGRSKYANKLNREQLEYQKLIEDNTHQTAKWAYQTNKVFQANYDEKMRKKINYEELFPSKNKHITVKAETSFYEKLKRSLR